MGFVVMGLWGVLGNAHKEQFIVSSMNDLLKMSLIRMPGRASVLCCAVLCCAVLCCAVLCCVVLCCAVWLILGYGLSVLLLCPCTI